MSSRDWRSGAAYDDLDDLSLRGLAWEYLRRNPDYVAEYENGTSTEPGEANIAESCKSWGLRFPGRPEPPCLDRTRLLASDIDVGSGSYRRARRTLRRNYDLPAVAGAAG